MRRQREIVSAATKHYFSLDKEKGGYKLDESGLLPGLTWMKDQFQYRAVVFNMDLTMMQNESINFVYNIAVFTPSNEWVGETWSAIKTSQINYNNSIYVNILGEEVPIGEATDPDTGEMKDGFYKQLDYVVGRLFKGTIEPPQLMYDFVLYDISAVEGLEIEIPKP